VGIERVRYNPFLLMRVRPGIRLASLSDVGCQRENNEDRCSYWEPASDEQFQRKGRLAIVADGMGGYEGGQEASRVAVETLESVYANASDGNPHAWLVAGFHAAHQRILDEADRNPELAGMGTTCTAIALLDQALYFAHVGDSRLYLVRDSSISRLTRDHSYVSRLVENGVIGPEEAESHPQRHILTAALGAGAIVTPDSPEEPTSLQRADVLVLCTDGLWSQVNQNEVHTLVTSNDPDQACRQLVDAARKRGGPDNITVQVIQVAA
jgi:serine/threonine protein phosphatase PrpC